MKEKLLDKDTIDAYHSYVQSQIRSDLNSTSLGPGSLPSRLAKGLAAFGGCCLIVGILLVTLRMRHVYFWSWNDQFTGPFFCILFLLCCSGATYLTILASRRSNRYRRELYFHPLGDYGIQAVHKDDLVHEQELKHDLKSGTTPHKSIMPRSEAYSTMNLNQPQKGRSGQHNRGYNHSPGDKMHRPHGQGQGQGHRGPPRTDDNRRRAPSDGRRGPPGDDRRRPPGDRRGPPPPGQGRRGPPPEGEYRRGPPPDDRRRHPDDNRGPPPEGRRDGPPEGYRGPPRDAPPDYNGQDRRGPPPDRRGPPRDDRRGPPPGDRRGPPPDDRRGPPPDDRRGPPPDDRRGPHPDDRRGPPPGDRRGPPPGDRRGSPPDDRRGPPPGDRRPRGPPRFSERSPDDGLGKVKLEDNRESESEL